MNKEPNDIDLENRKNIIREELGKLLGKPVEREAVIERHRLKNMEFDKKKVRRNIATASKKRNW